MSDDLLNRGPRDRTRVSLDEPWELRYWTKRFDVSEAKLRAACDAAGPLTSNVERHLGISASSE